MPRSDRRKARRAPLLIKVECSSEGKTALCRCQNISETGLLLLCAETFEPQSEVLVSFALPSPQGDTEIAAYGRVVRAQRGVYMAIEFTVIHESYRQAIAELLQ
jgi:hypothetical protein